MLVTLGCLVMVGCSFGPRTVENIRLRYNEVIKTTTEEQLLLNIVRLRYTDTPSSLAVSAIAAQFEQQGTLQLLPFFTAAGGDVHIRSFTSILPQVQWFAADRPTITLTPLDDQDFTRRLFTQLPLEGVLYLAKTTWPISTVFHLYLENLNDLFAFIGTIAPGTDRPDWTAASADSPRGWAVTKKNGRNAHQTTFAAQDCSTVPISDALSISVCGVTFHFRESL